MAAIIRERGCHIRVRELLNELTKRGIEVGGLNPASTLTARLARAPSLVFERPYGWRLREPLQTNEAAASSPSPGTAASTPSTPNDADRRGEVAYEKIAT